MSTLFKESKVTPGILLGQLFQSRDIAHLTHLRTKSYAEHKALNEYYDSLLDLTDALAESYFGKYGACEIKIPNTNYVNAVAHLKHLSDYIESNREVFVDSFLQNQIDEILQLIYKTMYLLTLS